MAWADEFRNLTREISNMHENRANYTHNLKSDIQQMIGNCNTERANMKSQLLANFSAWNETRTKEVADLHAAAQDFLVELNEADKARAVEICEFKEEVQAYLTKFRNEDMERVKAENKQRAKEVDELKTDIAKMISGFREEHEQAAAAWKDLIANMGNTKPTAEKKPKKEEREKKAADGD